MLATLVIGFALMTGCADGTADVDGPMPTDQTDAERASTSVPPTPTPPLPEGINTLPYGLGQIAALGNLQSAVLAVERVDAGPATDVVTVAMSFRNGSLSPLSISVDHILLYTVDGVGGGAVAIDGDGQTSPIASGDTIRSTVRFEIPSTSEPALVLVDASSADSRIQPGAFALEEVMVGEADS